MYSSSLWVELIKTVVSTSDTIAISLVSLLSQQKTQAAFQLTHSCGDYIPSIFVQSTLFQKILYKDKNNACKPHCYTKELPNCSSTEATTYPVQKTHSSPATKLTLHVNKNCWKQVPHHHFVNITFTKHKTEWPVALLILQKIPNLH